MAVGAAVAANGNRMAAPVLDMELSWARAEQWLRAELQKVEAYDLLVHTAGAKKLFNVSVALQTAASRHDA